MLLPSAVARYIVYMADVFLLKRVVLKVCGSPFALLTCGTFSAVVVFTFIFIAYWILMWVSRIAHL